MEYGILGRNNDLHSSGKSFEDNMQYTAHFTFTRDNYDRSLFLDSAKRVIFKNCMQKLELDDTQVPNFNRNFYYNQLEIQSQLQECFNTRIDLHFGHEHAKTH